MSKTTTATVGNEAQGAKYGVGFGEAFARFFQKYVDFKGAASRSEYWWAFLATTLISGILNGITHNAHGFWWVATLWMIAIIIPKLSVGVRRLHDAGKSGWLVILPTGLEIIGIVLALIGAILAGRDNAPSAVVLWGFILGGVIVWLVGLILSYALFALKTVKGAHVDDAAALEDLKKNPEAFAKAGLDEVAKDTEAAVKNAETEAQAAAAKATKAGTDAVNAAKDAINKK